MIKHSTIFTYLLIIFIANSLILSSFSFALSTNNTDSVWTIGDDQSNNTIDHHLWQKILDHYLMSTDPSHINLFNYKEVTPADKQQLTDYISQLQTIDPRKYAKKEQQAYWINLYNALTINLILDHYPVQSIKKIGGFFSFGPWDQEITQVMGHQLSLNDIEHKILRPIWQDPRIHYAVNCASYSCPNLSTIAYSGKNIEQLLNQGAEDYINHPRGVWFEDNQLYVSSIYHWYKKDFGGTDKTLLTHLLRYSKPSLSSRLNGYHGTIKDDYNWKLNQR
jgi:hypothetical protein